MNNVPGIDVATTTEPQLASEAMPTSAPPRASEIVHPDRDPDAAAALPSTRRTPSWLSWGLLAAFAFIVGATIVGMARHSHERSLPGPTDGVAPAAPR